MNDFLTLVTAASRTAPARHQTLPATLDWSYGLLTETGPADFLRANLTTPCGGLFVDHTKNGIRRWCSIDGCGCGSWAKMRRLYARQGPQNPRLDVPAVR